MILQPRSQRFVTDKVLWKLAGHTHTQKVTKHTRIKVLLRNERSERLKIFILSNRIKRNKCNIFKRTKKKNLKITYKEQFEKMKHLDM